MKDTMEGAKDPEGVGLAAPQIGKSLQIFIAKPFPKKDIMVFINPQIKEISPLADFSKVSQSKKTEKAKKRAGIKKGQQLEGCLSLKNIWGIVKRSPEVTVLYTDEKGNRRTDIFKGFLATIIQHEYDHLQGVLFPKRVLEQKGKLYKSEKDEKGDDVFDELKF